MRSTGFPHSLPLLVCGAVLASAVTQPAVAQQTADASVAPPAVAKPSAKRRAKSEGQPALLTADQIVHDRDLDIVTARGHVEVDQGGRILLADSLSYNMKQDVVVAAGNVSLTEETGEVTFADYIELTGDLKDGTTKSVRILMIDDSRIAANQGRRRAGDRSVFDKALYTACKPCEDDPDKPPLWDLKAEKVIHDEVEHLIEYEDAWLDIDGWPILYTPYMSHADPTVKRESGLLPFSVVNNKVIGAGVRVPYFFVIDPGQDLTVAPMITNKNDEMLAITDRLRTANGEAKTTFSIADLSASGYAGNATVGWHLDARARFDLDQAWRAGWDIQRSSDQNYLQAFGYRITDPYLTARPYVEGFGYRSYAAVEGYSFQSLTTPVLPAGAPPTPNSPVVLPLATYNFVGQPGPGGSFWSFNTHAAAITRFQGVDSRRINTQTAWNLPYTAPDGEVYKLTTGLRADAYNSDNLQPLDHREVNAGRAIPSISLDWRYPFTSLGDHSSQTLSPIVVASASPNGGNSLNIPNEDSLDFELDDTNIFSPSPASGYDRVVTGPRVAYGGQYSVVNRGFGAADVLLGQSYQMKPQTILPVGTGLDHRFSDIVGRTNVSPSSNVQLHYGFRLDHDNLTIRRSELSTSLGPRPLNLQMTYVFYDRLNPTSPFLAREQANVTLTTQMTRNWATQIYQIQNMGAGGGPLQSGLRLTYDDECLLFSADAGSRHTTNQTFALGHYFMLRIYLKTLTQIPVDVF